MTKFTNNNFSSAIARSAKRDEAIYNHKKEKMIVFYNDALFIIMKYGLPRHFVSRNDGKGCHFCFFIAPLLYENLNFLSLQGVRSTTKQSIE
jgi:hypothetical protein